MDPLPTGSLKTPSAMTHKAQRNQPKKNPGFTTIITIIMDNSCTMQIFLPMAHSNRFALYKQRDRQTDSQTETETERQTESITKSKHVLYWTPFTPNFHPSGFCQDLPS